MDVMRPKLQWIGTKCYRRFDITPEPSEYNTMQNNAQSVDDQYNDEPQCEGTKDSVKLENKNHNFQVSNEKADNEMPQLKRPDDDGCNDDIDDDIVVEEVIGNNGITYKTRLTIAQSFYGIILGKGAATKKRIEYDTKARIKVPNINESYDITISANTKSDVRSAASRVMAIVESVRSRSNVSHFISIPFNDDTIREKFIQLKNNIIENAECSKSRGVDESLFQNPNKLHMTIAVMFLADGSERQLASDILEKCDNEFIKPLLKGSGIRVRVEGLDYMNDDPSEVDILYAKVSDLSGNDHLRVIVNEVFTRFEKRKLLIRNRDFEKLNESMKVKMHITVMNTKFRGNKNESDDGRSGNGKTKERDTFDASNIIKYFGDYLFGDITLNSIHLSVSHGMGSKSGYFTHSHKISL